VKKLSPKAKYFQVRKARFGSLKARSIFRLSTYYTPLGPQTVFSKTNQLLPKKLCLHTNLAETISFFLTLRKQTISFNRHLPVSPKPIKRGSPRTFRNYFDFTTLESISTGAALILAAEFDRTFRTRGISPTTIDLDKWDSNVYATLLHLGFFKLMGFSDAQMLSMDVGMPDVLNSAYIMPMVSGKLADSSDIIDPLVALLDRAMPDPDDGTRVALCSALMDAFENVRKWAYPHWRHQLNNIPLWWLSGSVSLADHRLTISLYDQGVTIPNTMLKSDLWAPTFEAFKKLSGYSFYDSPNRDRDLLNSAMQIGETSSMLENRGLGLPKIKKIVSQCPGGSLLIMSNKGQFRLANGLEACTAMDLPLLGTYVELSATFSTQAISE
jgi:hypothetical protein